MKAKSIILFNHKGGVSKTLTTFNIAWMLAEKGKKEFCWLTVIRSATCLSCS